MHRLVPMQSTPSWLLLSIFKIFLAPSVNRNLASYAVQCAGQRSAGIFQNSCWSYSAASGSFSKCGKSSTNLLRDGPLWPSPLTRWRSTDCRPWRSAPLRGSPPASPNYGAPRRATGIWNPSVNSPNQKCKVRYLGDGYNREGRKAIWIRKGSIWNISADVELRGIGITDYNYSNPIGHVTKLLPTISNGFCKVFTFTEDIATYTYAHFSVARDIIYDVFILQVCSLPSILIA